LNKNGGATRPPKQLLIILDAMEWALVFEWARAGKLPTFRRLLEGGARAELASTAAQLPDTVWAAIYSGTNPAKFSKYFYVQYEAASGHLRMLNDDAIGATPFWDQLSAAGRRVCVLDVPKFPVSRGINGVHVTNWGSHATSTKRASEPSWVLDEINRRFGKHPVGDCDATDENPGSWRRLRRNLLAGIKLHGEMCRFLMEREDWDVFFAGFSETHCAGHHFWRFYDATNPGYDPADSQGFRDTIKTVYQAVDRQVGEMLTLVGPEVRCLVFSGHGMGPMNHASWNLQEMLDRLGFGNTAVKSHGCEDTSARVNPWRLLQMLLPGRFQYAVRSLLPRRFRDELIFRWYAGPRHWAGCRAIAVPNNESVGAIRVLVQGRDRHGIVQPGAEYRKICEDIAAALRELVDARSGRKVTLDVTLAHEEFHGPFVDGLPDITVLWDQSFAWHEVASPAIGRLTLRRQDSRTGSHTAHGFLLARGYGESPGTELPRATLYDIAPTVLSAAEVEIPGVMDGRPLFARSSAVPSS
jgi:predicted AlkP superfamily phosphohydrolase/phosphomutase